MSKVITLTLSDDQVERLRRAAAELHCTPEEAATTLFEEALRLREFPFVEFRDTPAGREPYLQGSRLAIWQVAWLARHYENDISLMAVNLDVPGARLSAALQYAAAYPHEIEQAIAENRRAADDVRQRLTHSKAVEVDAAAS